MAGQIDVILCKSCKGEGVHTTGKPCKNCMGVGVVGSDGGEEYFLGDDGTGSLKIIGIKSGLGRSHDLFPNKKNIGDITRWIFIAAIITLYLIYLGVHFFVLRDQKIFNIVTLITVGLVSILLLYDVGIVKKSFDKLRGIIFREPSDLISAVRKRSN